ncbi:hypothetical protein [Methylobacillus sp. MM3]|uniref:chorismate transformation enzyme, FkbO/Hyg5 family n=1 Tax=Methylobacillus sp. MM3 TaxID=1848039 RepID=UPI000B1AE466|nr:hypothetical protein [Methylobacillus sp. MM3]
MSDSSNTVLRNANLSLPALFGATESSLQHTLGAICFAERTDQTCPAADNPFLHVAMPILDGEPVCELWLGDGINATVKQGGVRYRRSENLLFGVIELNEADTDPIPLQQATESAYRQIFALLDELELPFVYRFWNYMADINVVSHGLERYRQFNLGRQDAFLACARDVVGELPSACALGTAEGPLQIAFLAGSTASLAIENPRQVNAYAYPEDYGPRSPTFSRASLLRLPESEVLFISGTASIVGHRTLHSDDVSGQTRETLANIEAVILEANRVMHHRWFDPSQLFYRVYVRHAADIEIIRNELRRLTGNHANAVFLQADICRDDLLLEIETTAFSCDRKNTDRQ